jgi:DNA mismatch repair protein MutS2
MKGRKQENRTASVRTVDLHGIRVEEAKELFLDTLDLCLRDGVDQLRVVHGFGTGKVKAAIYEILKSSRHVKNFRTEIGNQGVTVVYL